MQTKLSRFLCTICMFAMLLTCGIASAATADTVTVDNITDLMYSLRSNRTILLRPGDYNLSEWVHTVRAEARAKGSLSADAHTHIYSVGDDGASVVIQGTEIELSGFTNLTIASLLPSATPRILTEERYDAVLRILNSRSLTLEGISFGHIVEHGYCSGAVLYFEGVLGTDIRRCDLFGCGTYGYEAINSHSIHVRDSVIRDCSYGCISAKHCTDLSFTDTMFRDCESVVSLFDGENASLTFENCSFENLKGPLTNLFFPAARVAIPAG